MVSRDQSIEAEEPVAVPRSLSMRQKLALFFLLYFGGTSSLFILVQRGLAVSGPISVNDRIFDITYYPPTPNPGERITFDAQFSAKLAHLREQAKVKVLWAPQNRSSGGRGAGLPLSYYWVAPDEPGIAIFTVYVHTEDLVAISDPGFIPLPDSVPFIADSPLIQVSAERRGSFKEAPFARIVAKVAKNGSSPAIENLGASTLCFERYDALGTGERSGGPGAFSRNGTEDHNWIVYVAEPVDRTPDMGHPPGSAVVICWVVGRDLSGTIHFSRPLIYNTDMPEKLPSPYPCKEKEGPTIKILEMGYEPREPMPGQNITFHARCNVPAALRVNWRFFERYGDLAGGGDSPLERIMKSHDQPSVGMYQLHTYSNKTWTVSDFHPLIIPNIPYVKDSDLISLRAEEVGEWNGPPFAKLVTTLKDKTLANIHYGYTWYQRCGGSGGGGGGKMDPEGDHYIVSGRGYSDPYHPDPLSPDTIVFCWASGIDQDGVIHFSRTLNYTIGEPIPLVFGP